MAKPKPGGRRPRRKERNPEVLEVGPVLVKQPVLSPHCAVIGEKEHDRVVELPQGGEVLEDGSDGVVNRPQGAGLPGPEGLPARVARRRLPHSQRLVTFISWLRRRVERARGHIKLCVLVLGHVRSVRTFIGDVHIEGVA